jgi:hypothetical protein
MLETNTKHTMKNTETESLDLTPSWETAVKIYIMVLKNPKASPEAIRSAEGEITRLAQFVDSKAKK